MPHALLPLLVLFALVTVVPGRAQGAENDPNRTVRTALQGELGDVTAPGWDRSPTSWPAPEPGNPFVPAAGPALAAYRQRLVAVAGWTGGPVWHQAGTLPLVRAGRQAERLGVNLFVPAGPVRGTVLFVHGYMSHAANFAYTFAWFTARGWRVVTLDLPGHGLSTGPRADVDGFGEYGDAVAGWLDWVAIQSWPGPKVLVAHSLGTAACLEALRRPGTVRPDRVVFCAPLLKTAWYPVLSFGEASLGWWVKQVPSTFGWDGYLDGFVMPVHWFTALGQWLRAIETQRPLDLPLTIYAGDRDQVVDTGWNLAEYGRLVPGVREVVLPGKDHLFLSNREDREAFHRRLTADLGL